MIKQILKHVHSSLALLENPFIHNYTIIHQGQLRYSSSKCMPCIERRGKYGKEGQGTQNDFVLKIIHLQVNEVQ